MNDDTPRSGADPGAAADDGGAGNARPPGADRAAQDRAAQDRAAPGRMATSPGVAGGADVPWFTMPVDEVAQTLQVVAADGLSSAEAASRLQTHGRNELAEESQEPKW